MLGKLGIRIWQENLNAVFGYVQIPRALLQVLDHFTAMLARSNENNQLSECLHTQFLSLFPLVASAWSKRWSENNLNRAQIHFSKIGSTEESLKALRLTKDGTRALTSRGKSKASRDVTKHAHSTGHKEHWEALSLLHLGERGAKEKADEVSKSSTTWWGSWEDGTQCFSEVHKEARQNAQVAVRETAKGIN